MGPRRGHPETRPRQTNRTHHFLCRDDKPITNAECLLVIVACSLLVLVQPPPPSKEWAHKLESWNPFSPDICMTHMRLLPHWNFSSSICSCYFNNFFAILQSTTIQLKNSEEYIYIYLFSIWMNCGGTGRGTRIGPAFELLRSVPEWFGGVRKSNSGGFYSCPTV